MMSVGGTGMTILATSAQQIVFWATAPYRDRQLRLACTDTGLCCLQLPKETVADLAKWVARHVPGARLVHDPERLEPYVHELQEYFQGICRQFTVPLDLRGTPFQLSVWAALSEIPYGQTRTYAQIAQRIGKPRAVRAVGAANGCNPVAIVVPCHRVIGKDGSLVGYSGGLDIKEDLLQLEA